MGGRLCVDLKPAAAMVVVQMVFAGVNILYKLSINDGMNMSVLVAYRYLFATAFMAPLAFFVERNSRPSLTWKILLQAFFCGLFGGSLAQNLYVPSIKLTSASFASAMTNLIPAITFILAVIFRLEKLGIRTFSGQAKVVGTVVGISGAMLLTFYKGPEVNLWTTSVNLLHKSHVTAVGSDNQVSGNRVMGSLLAIASCFSYAIWLIIQAKMSMDYPCVYSSTALMCLMGSIQGIVFALCVEGDWAQWRMGFDIRLLTVCYTGAISSGLIFTVLAWCIKKKGPLYASVFNPLMLVIVAILGSLILEEKLHLGSILGAVMIVIGLYAVLWGKGREVGKVAEFPDEESIDVVIMPQTTSISAKDRDPASERKQELTSALELEQVERTF